MDAKQILEEINSEIDRIDSPIYPRKLIWMAVLAENIIEIQDKIQLLEWAIERIDADS